MSHENCLKNIVVCMFRCQRADVPVASVDNKLCRVQELVFDVNDSVQDIFVYRLNLTSCNQITGNGYRVQVIFIIIISLRIISKQCNTHKHISRKKKSENFSAFVFLFNMLQYYFVHIGKCVICKETTYIWRL